MALTSFVTRRSRVGISSKSSRSASSSQFRATVIGVVGRRWKLILGGSFFLLLIAGGYTLWIEFLSAPQYVITTVVLDSSSKALYPDTGFESNLIRQFQGEHRLLLQFGGFNDQLTLLQRKEPQVKSCEPLYQDHTLTLRCDFFTPLFLLIQGEKQVAVYPDFFLPLSSGAGLIEGLSRLHLTPELPLDVSLFFPNMLPILTQGLREIHQLVGQKTTVYYLPGGRYLIVDSPDHPRVAISLIQSLEAQILSRKALLSRPELYRTIALLDFTNPSEPIIVKKDPPKPQRR